MRTRIVMTLAAAGLALAATASVATGRPTQRGAGVPYGIGGGFGAPSGRAPWSLPYEYDSGGGNDRRPELPYYQRGGGQQTGGPARNLLPDDGLHLFPQ